MLVLRDDAPAHSIPQFFAGREVFIIGATGFMGKVLIERLLWTCPDVGRLHLLVRDKAGAAPTDRLLALKRSQVFDVVRTRSPAQLDKLSLVCGDITRPGLGIAADALAKLQEVSVVFNCAATVRYDEPLRRATELNALSVVRLLDVLDRLPSVKAFVHVSTGYCNTDHATIAERVYPLPSELPSMLASALATPDHTSQEEIKRIIHPNPNTYTYTKMMGEAAVAERSRGYPVAIFRPTIVTGALQDPVPGWTESYNGPNGVILAICSGLLRVFCSKDSCRADILPVNIAIDTLISVAWETALDDLNTVRVYNCSTTDNPTTWGELRGSIVETGRKFPLASVAWYPSCFTTGRRIIFETVKLFVQTIPFYVIEYLIRIFNHQKSRMNLIKLHSRLSYMCDNFQYFATNEWTFSSDNVRSLRARLAPADAATFNLDVGSIDWKKYYEHLVRGCCLYIAKDNEENLPESRKRLQSLNTVRVYNCSTTDNPTTWGELRGSIVETGRKFPLASVAWYPSCFTTGRRIIFETVKLFVQTIPFYVIEYLIRIFNHQKSRMNLIKLHSRLSYMCDNFQYFATNEWTFSSDNVRSLRARLAPADAATFNLDVGSIDWKKYYEHLVRGCCLYIAKDNEENLPESRKRLQRMYLVQRTLTILLPALLLYQLLNPGLVNSFVQHSLHFPSVIFLSIGHVSDGFTHFFGVVLSWIHV